MAILKQLHLLCKTTKKSILKNSGIENSCRMCSTKLSKHEAITRRSDLFSLEAKRQREAVGRIEKIKVHYLGTPENFTLIMNKHISTPYNCAQHMYEMLTRRSVLALINSSEQWDMHRPLEEDCELQLLHFQNENPTPCNKAFWRSCSFILGAVANTALKDDMNVTLHSFPWPNVRSGSFVYDVEIDNLDSWKPTIDELKILSSEMVKFSQKNLPIERLSISEELALDMFSDNKHKVKQIPDIASQSTDKKVTVYRVGKHVDISRGPMIGNTSFIGRCTITTVIKLDTDKGNYYRFQGVSIPKGLMINHYAYSILEQRARKLNKGLLPWQHETETFHPVLQAIEASA